MSDLTSYRIRDFLLFSKDTLLEIYQSYNLDYWPWQIVSGLFVLYSVFTLLKPSRWRFQLVFLGLAGAWAWVALVFHLRYFEPINWASRYFANAFLIEAFLLLIFCTRTVSYVLPQPLTSLQKAGVTAFVIASLVPFELLWSLDLSHVLIFGWGAERTAAATFILLSIVIRGPARYLLMIIPGLWLLLSIAVLSVLK